ncbi:MAG: hypothetical protein OXU20_12480 [Myxococcales bacterium]|nr:hypothetical protein [Myxococcales bacterium]
MNRSTFDFAQRGALPIVLMGALACQQATPEASQGVPIAPPAATTTATTATPLSGTTQPAAPGSTGTASPPSSQATEVPANSQAEQEVPEQEVPEQEVPEQEVPEQDGAGSGGVEGPPPTPNLESEMESQAQPEMEPEVDLSELEKFSFFVTSLEVMQELSGSPDGFGGDLGGLEGADAICQQAADRVGFGAKTWRAFLSATDGGDGQPVHAIDRIGDGPWYDRNGRLVADNRAGLLSDRPAGDAQTINDLPNEFGEGLKQFGDTHDVMTGTNAMGQLDSPDPANTCNDWTSTTAMPGGGPRGEGGPPRGSGFPRPGSGFPTGGGGPGGSSPGLRLGHSWPARSGASWIAVHPASSCAAGVNLVQNGPGDRSSVGAGGGWGGIYCFALTP